MLVGKGYVILYIRETLYYTKAGFSSRLFYLPSYIEGNPLSPQKGEVAFLLLPFDFTLYLTAITKYVILKIES